MSNIASQAVGKWPSILISLGVDQAFLKNKHGACPICGGKDRFRFDNRDGKGTYFCSQCGSGDGFNMLQKINNWTFAEAANQIEGIIGKCRAYKPQQQQTDSFEKNEARLLKIKQGLRRISHDDIAVKYLLSRGITILPKRDVYFHSAIDYYAKNSDDRPVKVGTFPAMVSAFRNDDDELCTYHVTYLTQDSKKLADHPAKKIMPKIRDLSGGAIKFGGIAETIVIAEGIETALSAQQEFGYPAWAASSAVLLEQVEIPDYVQSVLIVADEDKSFTGQKSSYTLANKLHVKCGKDVSVVRILSKTALHIDVGLDADFLDYCNA